MGKDRWLPNNLNPRSTMSSNNQTVWGCQYSSYFCAIVCYFVEKSRIKWIFNDKNNKLRYDKVKCICKRLEILLFLYLHSLVTLTRITEDGIDDPCWFWATTKNLYTWPFVKFVTSIAVSVVFNWKSKGKIVCFFPRNYELFHCCCIIIYVMYFSLTDLTSAGLSTEEVADAGTLSW